jgi:hypothetical protein
MTFTFNVGTNSGRGPLLLTGGLHFIILAIAGQADSPEVWPWALLAMSVVSFFAWIGNYRRYRIIHDLPTSNVASAAQGYVELVGVGRLIDGVQIYCPISQRPCCWYRYTVEEEQQDDKWKTVDEGSSVAHFLLVDDSGPCVISPDGAEVITGHHKTWREGRMRYSETLLLPDAPLYAIGEFITHTGNVPTPADERSDVGALLSDWKNDKATLLKRFDLDGDGKISLKEWELARMQAMREVRKRRAEQLGNFTEGVHLLRKPSDGRLFLLAGELPDDLGRRYKLWSWFHLAAFLGMGITGLILLGVK